MTKEEKIKEAWGENWSKISKENQKKALKNNGFVSQYYEDLLSKETICRKLFDVRPKSLQGIENNNGWFIITDDLEFTTETFWLYNSSNKDLFRGRLFDDDKLPIHRYATHYQQIDKPKPPIY